MHTLEQLRSGELAGISRLDLSANLTEFPREIFDLADSLEILNLSGNQLSRLPDDLPRLHKLKVIFCSDNPFSELPDVLGECPQLEMVGFKACRIKQVADAALPARLRWLILTDNRLRQLPSALGQRPRLQKLMLSGNQLSALPDSLAEASNLELLRLAANRFEALPDWLGQLPRLSWLAFSGNPCSPFPAAPDTRVYSRDEVRLGELLGQGASGLIHAGLLQDDSPVAAKLFKGQVTSDGLPQSEMAACLAAGEHPNLIGVKGILHTEQNSLPALLMERLPPRYRTLAGPPSLASCTRDCYPADWTLSTDHALRIARGTAEAVAHLHARGMLHGDLYGHNLLVDGQGHTLLSDFGGATFIDPASLQGQRLTQLESRAFGCLLEELLNRCAPDDQPQLQADLRGLQHRCLQTTVGERPDFTRILQALQR
ncbi:MAG TPA: leucine-rich repeat-containing protein kinase family protein [Pseudomonas sp.]|jgi:hypothetical protein|nr:leucine-rich repeat-containing protein kinase family protein [Pseudomonas sp.]